MGVVLFYLTLKNKMPPVFLKIASFIEIIPEEVVKYILLRVNLCVIFFKCFSFKKICFVGFISVNICLFKFLLKNKTYISFLSSEYVLHQPARIFNLNIINNNFLFLFVIVIDIVCFLWCRPKRTKFNVFIYDNIIIEFKTQQYL